MLWSSGVLVLVLSAAGLLVVACFQARDVFRSDASWTREMRRYRRSLLGRIPAREKLSWPARLLGSLGRLSAERAQWHDAVEDLTDQREIFQQRVRVEIDRLVGKEVYHGQKEQL